MSDNRTIDSLRDLRRDLPDLAKSLCIRDPQMEEWARTLDLKLFPRVDRDFPLIAAICGGGSSGKSTLFNTLVNSKISPTGGRAGINRRVLIAVGEATALRKDFLLSLYDPFDVAPEQLVTPETLEEPGIPLYTVSGAIPENLILLDTPDFDTGAKGSYVNRQEAQKALETADVFIYIFTNSNYNNRDNTDFISQMLTGIGMRKSFLVYRAYPSFTDAEVCEHAMTVAKNIYGHDALSNILGIYRADENNAVAAGEAFLSLKPADVNYPPLHEAIHFLDRIKLREALLESIQTDAILKAKPFFEKLYDSRKALSRYLNTLETMEQVQVRKALRRFPADRIMKRFIEIWLASDPPLLRALRKTGRIVEIPFKVLVKAVNLFRPSATSEMHDGPPLDYQLLLESDLLHAAHELFSAALSEKLSLPDTPGYAATTQANDLPQATNETYPVSANEGHATFDISAPPVVFPEQKALSDIGWQATRDALLSKKETLIKLSDKMDKELMDIADGFRKRMHFSDRVRQNLSAALNILPATVAVTYILHTGDPVGAVGIKVKLAGLLGVKDLYALLAIPATAGLKAADMKQLQEMLDPLARMWFNHKQKETTEIFKSCITLGILNHGKKTLEHASVLLNRIEEKWEALNRSDIAHRPSNRETPDAR